MTMHARALELELAEFKEKLIEVAKNIASSPMHIVEESKNVGKALLILDEYLQGKRK